MPRVAQPPSRAGRCQGPPGAGTAAGPASGSLGPCGGGADRPVQSLPCGTGRGTAACAWLGLVRAAGCRVRAAGRGGDPGRLRTRGRKAPGPGLESGRGLVAGGSWGGSRRGGWSSLSDWPCPFRSARVDLGTQEEEAEPHGRGRGGRWRGDRWTWTPGAAPQGLGLCQWKTLLNARPIFETLGRGTAVSRTMSQRRG